MFRHPLNAGGNSPIIFMWSVEMLSVERFAERMDISEGTVWAWIRDNTLKEHRHFFQKNKIIRFPWGPELIKALMEDELFDKIEENPATVPSCNKNNTATPIATNIPANLPVPVPNGSVKPITKPSKPFGDVLPHSTVEQPSICASKSAPKKRRIFSGCPINPDLLK